MLLGKPADDGGTGLSDVTTTLELPQVDSVNATVAKSRGDIVYVRMNSADDSQSLQKSLALSGGLAGAFLVSFALLRRLTPEVYTRMSSVPDEDQGMKASDVNGFLDWLCWVWQTTPDREVEASGLDGWAVLAFYRLTCQLFAILGFFLLAVLLPLHWVFTNKQVDPLSRLDIGNLPVGSPVFWVHGFLVWFVVLVCNSIVLKAHEEFLQRRFDWLKAIPEPRASTLMVENIPHNLRSDAALRAYFADLFREDALESAYVVRKAPQLRKRMQWLGQVKYQLLLEESRWEQSEGKLEGGRDKVVRCEALREDAVRMVAEELAAVERAVAEQDPQVVSPNGFVTFTSEFWQRLASREQFRADVNEFVVSVPPDPEDVLWQDLTQDSIQSGLGEVLGCACLVLIFLFWSPVVAFISTLTTLQNLARILPFIMPICEKHPGLQALIQGFLATAALKLFLSFLPNVLMFVIRRFFTLKAGTLAQLRLQRWYYSFLLIFVLLVTMVGRSALITASEIAKSPGSLINRLSTTLPSASHFYFSYMVLGWFTLPYELLRLMNIVRYAYLHFIIGFDAAIAKQYSEPEDEDGYGVGSRMGMAVLMCSIALVFCQCSPLILIFSFVYFVLGRFVYGYLLVHGETKKPDLGGHVFFEALRQVLFILLMFVVLMTGVLLKHSGAKFESFSWRSVPGPPVVAGCAVLAVMWAWRRLNSLAWDSLPLEEVVRASRAREAAAKDGVIRGRGGRYIQRECDLDLLMEDAEKVAATRANATGSGIAYAVHDYVRSAADLVDFGSQAASHGTGLATAVVDQSLGAVDRTVQGFVHYGATGASAFVDGSSEAATLFSRTFAVAKQWVRGHGLGRTRAARLERGASGSYSQHDFGDST